MNRLLLHSTLTTALLAGLIAGPTRADITIPTEATPPSTAQVQQAPAKQPAPAAATPVAVAATTEAAAAAQQDAVVNLLRTVIADAPAVVLVDNAPAPAAVPEGYAKNVATEPAPARYTVRLAVAAPQSGVLSADYLPVTLTVADAKNKTLGTEELRYRKTDETAFSKAARTFLGKHLPLSGPADPKPAATGPQAPRLQTWIESSDGDAMKIGSRVVFYFQASAKGYVSLYHFASGGAVQRIYPTEQEPDNFVEPGRTYRYPQHGDLELKGPAGEETVKAILTVLPSNTPKVLPGGLSYKGDPLQVIPTHYPVLFANRDLSRFFALPPHLYTETHIRYTLKPR